MKPKEPVFCPVHKRQRMKYMKSNVLGLIFGDYVCVECGNANS